MNNFANMTKKIRRTMVAVLAACAALVLSLFLAGVEPILVSLGAHHDHACDELSLIEESNPCHQTIHHHGHGHSEVPPCNHDAHITLRTEQCALCMLLCSCIHQPFEPSWVEHLIAADSHEDIDGIDTDHPELSLQLLSDSRGPPSLS